MRHALEVSLCDTYHYDTLYTMPGRIFTTLLEQAQRQYGYLTPEDAGGLGIDPTQLRLMAARGTLERVGRGLYRMPVVPATSLDAYMEGILWTGRRGVLSHETALELHELCEVNPSAIHFTVPSGFRTRKTVPEIYRLHPFDLDPAEVGSHEGIPIVTPERAILGGIEQALGWQLIDQAIQTARARGLITRPAAKRLAAMRHVPRVARGG
jgi:predicted transcriptional regulator of viral defense system